MCPFSHSIGRRQPIVCGCTNNSVRWAPLSPVQPSSSSSSAAAADDCIVATIGLLLRSEQTGCSEQLSPEELAAWTDGWLASQPASQPADWLATQISEHRKRQRRTKRQLHNDNQRTYTEPSQFCTIMVAISETQTCRRKRGVYVPLPVVLLHREPGGVCGYVNLCEVECAFEPNGSARNKRRPDEKARALSAGTMSTSRRLVLHGWLYLSGGLGLARLVNRLAAGFRENLSPCVSRHFIARFDGANESAHIKQLVSRQTMTLTSDDEAETETKTSLFPGEKSGIVWS